MATTFGSELKHWRGARRLSQLGLSVEAGVSARHISFLELGRSKPSAEMVLHLSEVLDIPKSERNQMLTAAGFAPRYVAHDLSSEAMAPIRSAISWTLDRHNPYPAMVLDRHWNVVEANKTAESMFAMMGQPSDVSLIELLLGDQGVRDCIDNWDEVGLHLLRRLKTEKAFLGSDETFENAIVRLQQILSDTSLETREKAVPLVAVNMTIGGMTFSMFSSIAQFGSADDFALADLKVELYFPADDTTRTFFETLNAL